MSVVSGARIDPEVVRRFASHLDEFATTLDDEEFAVLEAMVEAAMRPLDRMRRRAADEVLSPDEQETLRRLLGREQPAG